MIHPDHLAQIKSVIATADLPALGPAVRPGIKSPPVLRAQLEAVLAKTTLSNLSRQLLHCGALLWHDHLDESHTIAQDIGTPEGSMLHGIMHRREPDYGNAKYWFRRVGSHPSFASIASQVTGEFASHNDSLAARLAPNQRWDPFAFIDAVEEAENGAGNLAPALREIQRIEFEALLDHICGRLG